MKKLMLMSALASAILITTATTSCKKGDQGPAGANGVGKDGKTSLVGTSQAVKSALKVYTEASTAGLGEESVNKAAELVTVEDRHNAVLAASLSTTAEVKKAVSDLEAKIKLVDELDELVNDGKTGNLFSSDSSNVTTLVGLIVNENVVLSSTDNKIFVQTEIEKNALVHKFKSIKDINKTLVEAKSDLQADIEKLKKLSINILSETKDIQAAIQAAKKIQVTDVEGNKLVLEYASNLVDAAQGKNKEAIDVLSVSKALKQLAIKKADAKKELKEAIAELDALKPAATVFSELKITDVLRKELGLVAATVAPNKQ